VMGEIAICQGSSMLFSCLGYCFLGWFFLHAILTFILSIGQRQISPGG
jgi:hypothetical protein